MKAFLILLVAVFSLGTALSLHLRPEAFLYIPLYALAVYHIYRLNISEGFFLVFLEKTTKDESARVRLGPAELQMKDEADHHEDKFLAIFDWKRSAVRKIVSWSVFCGTIWLILFRFHLEMSLETIMPAVVALFLMRVVAVGHFLIPLGMNLLLVILAIPDFRISEWVAFTFYGVGLTTTLALIYPSEERMGKKLSEWLSGKWVEILRTVFILLISFAAGAFLFPRKFEEPRPEVDPKAVTRSERELVNMESSIRNLARMGLLKNEKLSQELLSLKGEISAFHQKTSKTKEEWARLNEKQENLTKTFQQELTGAETPTLTNELLEYMKNDLRSRDGRGIDPATFAEMQKLLQRMDKFQGQDGSDLVADYRELKYGNKGFYSEETELEAPTLSIDSGNSEKVWNMIEAESKKQELVQKLDQNIEALRNTPDQGLQAVNDALKKELSEVDSLTPLESEFAKQELLKAKELQEEMVRRGTADPELAAKLEKLMDENRQLLNQMTPHMNASEKSRFAQRIMEQRNQTEAVRAHIRNRKAEELYQREKAEELARSRNDEKKDNDDTFAKFARLGTILAFAFLAAWFANLFRKKGVKKVRGVPDEVKEEIEQKLEALKKRKLSPREEIIETYNVLHDSLRTLLFMHETPPSCIVYEGIRAAEPELSEPTYTITEIFAKTFYGEREVTSPDLKAFRKDVTRVFRFFDIRT